MHRCRCDVAGAWGTVPGTRVLAVEWFTDRNQEGRGYSLLIYGTNLGSADKTVQRNDVLLFILTFQTEGDILC